MTKHLLSTFSNERGGSVRPSRARRSTPQEVEDFPVSGNVGLHQCLTFAGLSNSKAYQDGLVPMYDDKRNRIDPGKEAPFPWLPMPDSIVREPGQRKLFLAEEIRAWRDAITHRSRQIDGITLNSPNALYARGDNHHG
jgi:hypothetical protein